MKRFARVLLLGAGLVVATSACQLDVTMHTSVRHDGSGNFQIRFALDKELVDIAHALSDDPLKSLTTLPPDLTSSGWRIRRDSTGGGLTITVERSFSSPSDLNHAVASLRQSLSTQQGPTARFFDLTVARSSGFIRSSTSVRGTIDLTSYGLLGRSGLAPATQRQLQSLLDQQASQFFRFTLDVSLPGGVSSAKGGQPTVRSGTAEWLPQLGKTLTFEASSSAYNPALSVIGGAIAVAVALLVGLMARRRRRTAPAA